MDSAPPFVTTVIDPDSTSVEEGIGTPVKLATLLPHHLLYSREKSFATDAAVVDSCLSLIDTRLGKQLVAQSVGLYTLSSSLALYISQCAEELDGHLATSGPDGSQDLSLAACALNGLNAPPSRNLHSTNLATQETRILLPKVVEFLLANQAKYLIPWSCEPNLMLLVADLGVTDHLIPDFEAFHYYKRIDLGDNSPLPVLGRGTTIIKMNEKRIVIWTCVPLL